MIILLIFILLDTLIKKENGIFKEYLLYVRDYVKFLFFNIRLEGC